MTQFLPWITGPAGALVVMAAVAWALYRGKLHSDSEFRAVVKERDEYKATVATERKAADEMASAGTVTNQLIGALASLASERRYTPAQKRPAPDITGDDLGLLP